MADFQKYKVKKDWELYSDISTNLQLHPETKQIVRITDEASVKRSLRNIILTDKYERPYSDMDGGVKALLFELNTAPNRKTIQSKIENVIQNHEPRVKVIDVLAQGSDDEH